MAIYTRVSSVCEIVTGEGRNLQDLTGIEFRNFNAREYSYQHQGIGCENHITVSSSLS